MPNIFISYRREDSSIRTGRLSDRLISHFGEQHVFMDIDTITPGDEFSKVILERVTSCNSLLAVIGPAWLTCQDNDGVSRLQNKKDLLILEISSALNKNVRVIPVLVDGAEMPKQDELPEILSALALRNAVQIRDDSFRRDVDHLIDFLEMFETQSNNTLEGNRANLRQNELQALGNGSLPEENTVLSNEVRLLNGISQLADALRSTLGPVSSNTLIKQTSSNPEFTNNSIDIINQITCSDPIADMGANIVKEGADQIFNNAGDGCATTIILVENMYRQGLKYLSDGHNAQELKRGMEWAKSEILSWIGEVMLPVDEEQLERLIQLACKGDTDASSAVASAIKFVGKSGVIQVEEGVSLNNEIQVVEGMRFDRGYLSSYFVSNESCLSIYLQNPLILICDKDITSIRQILTILENVAKEDRPFLIITTDIDDLSLKTLVVNHMRDILKVCVVKAPGFGNLRKSMLQDIATLTNGYVISEEIGLSLEKATLEDLGTARMVSITKDSTTIIDGAGSAEDIKQRIAQIKAAMDKSTTDYDIEKIQERLTKLKAGVAIINAGAETENKMKAMKVLLERLLLVARGAVEEGVVAGGGATLLKAAAQIIPKTDSSASRQCGIEIVLRACQVPIRQIASNAGANPDVVINEILKQTDVNYGFNALTGDYEDLSLSAIMDSAKVVRQTLEVATSLVEKLLITEVTLAAN